MVIRWYSSEFKMIWLLVNDDESVLGGGGWRKGRTGARGRGDI